MSEPIGAMHDWTLLNITFEWEVARVTIEMRAPGQVLKHLVAEGVVDLRIPKKSEWGPSVSVNEASQVGSVAPMLLKIEMQTGDTIEIVAGRFAVSR